MASTFNSHSHSPSYNCKKLCIFCYKTTPNVSQVPKSVSDFLKFVERFLGEPLAARSSDIESNNNNCLGCCAGCRLLLTSFCELYHQIKCIELKLQWRLGCLVNIMRLANRVPSRVKQLKFILEESQSKAKHYCKEGNCPEKQDKLSTLKIFRTDMIRKSTLKLSKSQPRVWMERHISKFQTRELRHQSSLPEILKLENDKKNIHAQNNRISIHAMELFLGWIMSISIVVMLVSYNVTAQSFSINLCHPHQKGNYSPDLDDGTHSDSCDETNDHELTLETSYDNSTIDKPFTNTGYINKEYNKFSKTKQSLQSCTDLVIPRFNVHKTRNEPLESLEASQQAPCIPSHSREPQQSSNLKRFSCSMCSKSFTSKKFLKSHVVCHEARISTPLLLISVYRCLYCKQQFTSYAGLQIHKFRSKRHQARKKLKNRKTLEYWSLRSCSNTKTGNICEENNASDMKFDVKVFSGRPYELRERMKRSYDEREQDGPLQAGENNFQNSEDDVSSSSSSSDSDVSIEWDDIRIKKKPQHDNRVYRKTKSRAPHSKPYLGCKLDGCQRKPFPNKVAYNKHKKFHAPGCFKCKFCEVVEENVVRLSVHEINKHAPKHDPVLNKIYSCPRCFYQSKSYWWYKVHFAEAHIPGFRKVAHKRITLKTNRGMECDICKLGLYKKNKEKHFQIFHETTGVSPNRIWKCEYEDCQAYFVKVREKLGLVNRKIASHKRKVHPQIIPKHELGPPANKENKLSCKLCDEKFLLKSQFQNHNYRCHKNDNKLCKWKVRNNVRCPVATCREKFQTKQQLQSHQKLHATIKCKFCEVVKDYAPDLAIHEAETHSMRSTDEMKKLEQGGPTYFCCSRCSSSFRYKGQFQIHFLRAHLDLSSMGRSCEICGAEGSGERFFVTHFKLFHNTEGLDPSKLYRCDLCPAYFILGNQRFLHKLKIHYKDRCPECDKSCYETHREKASSDQTIFHFLQVRHWELQERICRQGLARRSQKGLQAPSPATGGHFKMSKMQEGIP